VASQSSEHGAAMAVWASRAGAMDSDRNSEAVTQVEIPIRGGRKEKK
jgi:hypothetical protein